MVLRYFSCNHPQEQPRQAPTKPPSESPPPSQPPPAPVTRLESWTPPSAKAEEVNKADEENAWRTWKSANGSYTVEAKLVSRVAGAVYLEKRDGTVVKVTTDKLCEDDLKWIRVHNAPR